MCHRYTAFYIGATDLKLGPYVYVVDTLLTAIVMCASVYECGCLCATMLVLEVCVSNWMAG